MENLKSETLEMTAQFNAKMAENVMNTYEMIGDYLSMLHEKIYAKDIGLGNDVIDEISKINTLVNMLSSNFNSDHIVAVEELHKEVAPKFYSAKYATKHENSVIS